MTEPTTSSYEVPIGTAIVSYIEPHAGHAREFNRWYERDHFPAAVTAGPGVFAHARWVATRKCKELRPPGTLLGDPARGSYLSLAWLLEDTQPQWDAFVVDTMPRLRAQDRMFAGRDHVHTAVYAPRWEARAREGPPAGMALDHGFAGVIAIAIAGHDAGREWAGTVVDDELPTIVALGTERVILSATNPGDHQLVLAFCAADPLQTWARARDALKDLDAVGFASPFLRTIPGTDAYVDEL
jgi:hypothetical protein